MFLELVSNEKNMLGSYIWRYFAGIVIVVIGLFVGAIPFALTIFLSGLTPEKLTDFEKSMDFSVLGIDPNTGLLLLITQFAFGLVALFVAVRLLHNKNFKKIITSQPKIRWDKVFYAFFLWFVLSAFLEFVSYLMYPENYEFLFDLELFLPLLLISVLLLPIQTSFEEIFMRGYLMQGIGLVGVYRLTPLIVTSLIFGLLHFANPEVEKFGFAIMMVFYVSFGLILGIITIMDDGLEIPLGIHAANNIFAAAVVSYSGGALQTNALFKVKELNPEFMLGLWITSSIFAIIVFSKKYKWASFNKLFKKIEFDLTAKDKPKDIVKEDFFEITDK